MVRAVVRPITPALSGVLVISFQFYLFSAVVGFDY